MIKLKSDFILPALAALFAVSAGAFAQEASDEREGFYKSQRSFVPRSGEGTFSKVGKTDPKLEKDTGGRDVLRVSGANGKEVNLTWTFWGHKQPPADQWPLGPGGRASLTLSSTADITIRPRLVVLTSEWSEPVSVEPVTLTAGEPSTIEIPLPETLAGGAIERLSIVLAASEPIPDLTVTDWSVGEQVPSALYPPDQEIVRTTNPVVIGGRIAGGGAAVVEARGADGGKVKEWHVTAGDDGRFEFEADRGALPSGPITLRAAPQPRPGAEAVWSNAVPLYVFPLLKEGVSLSSVAREGRNFMVDGKPWAFLGLNYTRFGLEFSRRPNYEILAEDLRQYGDWGINVIRVTMHLGMFQPRPGVFPDDPEYAKILKSHNVDPGFFKLFEYCIAVAGHHGIRVVLDWHEMPTNPYRYFVGGEPKDKEAGLPGKGIAWLYDQEKKEAVKPGDPRFTQAIVEANRWLAKRFRGNGNILGFEVPYNEPHSKADSGDLAWRSLTAETLLPIIIEDPTRLTFGMPSAWGHNNVQPSCTWMLPDYLTGMAPHHYLANGPIPVRADARERKSPWLAREIGPTFEHSFFAVALPYSAAPWPVWNGESGEHGYASFQPGKSHRDAAAPVIEAQIVQAYAAGWAGTLGWTLTGDPKDYKPVADIYERTYRRFSPVYAAGPVDQDRAEVLFVQNPAAVPVVNGLNHACVPFARLALDLHLAPVHYMTDDQLIATGLVQIAVGLEQVEHADAGLKYKAAIVDTRNLDVRALDLLERTGIPLLVVEDAARLSAEELAAFLNKAGVTVDERTPPNLQLIEGPGHLLIYRRSGEGPAKVFPRLRVEGSFDLIDEEDRTIFSGTADELAQKGLDTDLRKWCTAIFRIRKQ